MDEGAREIELKFLIDPSRREALLKHLDSAEGTKVRRLVSTYFDTPRQVLRHAGFTLRIRRDGRRWTQTVKSAAGREGGLGRGEWECAATAAGPDLAWVRGTPAGGALPRNPRLRPLFTVSVERRGLMIDEPAGRIEISLDAGEACAGGPTGAFCELEMELKSGSPAALLALARRLGDAFELCLSFTTKADRGFALIDRPRDRARHFKAPHLNPDMTAGQGFAAIARPALEQIAGNVEALQAAPSAETVHQMRVGARRLRASLKTFETLLDDRHRDHIETELKWLAAELDPARNLDVYLAGAFARAEHGVGGARLAPLGRRLRADRALAYARARDAADAPRLRRLLLDTLVWIETGDWMRSQGKAERIAEEDVRDFAARALEMGRRKLVKAGRGLAERDPEHRHRVRIKAKTLRYAAEGFVPVFDGHPKRARRFLAKLETLLENLGELNDIVAGEALALGVEKPATLRDAEIARATGLVESVRGAFAEFKAAKPFW